MINSNIKFELKLWIKSPSFYFYSFIFFITALFSLSGSAGIFGEGSSDQGIANSPIDILSTAMFFNKLFMLLIPAVIGIVISRDYSSGTYKFLFSYPIKKSVYLSGKFISGFLIIFFISTLVMCGMSSGLKLPGVNTEQVLDFDFAVYMKVFILYLLPNIFFISVIVFSIVSKTKNIYTGFLAMVMLLLMSKMLSGIMLSSGFGFPSVTVDPFGELYFEDQFRYVSASKLSVTEIPFKFEFYLNRIFWLTISAVILFFTFKNFSFREVSKKTGRALFNIRSSKVEDIKVTNSGELKFDFNFYQNLKSIWQISKYNFCYITKNISFKIISILSAVFIAVLILKGNTETGVKLLPVTWTILSVPFLFYSLIIIFLTFLYSGLLISRSESSGMKELEVMTPVPDYVLYFSKLLALVKIQIILLIIMIITGIIIQIYSSYYNFDIWNYIYTLFGIHLVGFIIWAVFSLFIQTIVTNPFTGVAVLILFYFGIDSLPLNDAAAFVIKFNKNPEPDFFLRYSEISGFGHSIYPYFISKIYWVIFCFLLINLTITFSRREKINSFKDRLRGAQARFHGKTAAAGISLSIIIIITGIYLYREKRIESEIVMSENQKIQHMNFYKNEFGKCELIPQPRIVKVNFNMDIFPDINSFEVNGYYLLINKTNLVIDTILLKSGYDETTFYEFSDGAELMNYDSVLKFSVYKLNNKIEPFDTIKINFNIKNISNTLLTQNSNILENGTFIKSDIFPKVGYIKDDYFKNPVDSINQLNHYQRYDSDLIEFEATISTNPEQIVTAPGKLLSERDENGRKIFHFKSDEKIKFVFGINSGEYKIYNETHDGKSLSIYFQKDHHFSLNDLMDGLKSALDYNTKYFSEYKYNDVKLVEFPRTEGSYATASANIIQISEIRFINDTRNAESKNTDIAFYTAAHELTHHWWGNQVIPADAQGAYMLTESITEYITAKIYESKHGKEKALDFLNIQYKRYLKGRAEETEKEFPLIYVNPEQTYISYGKGALAFYILSEYIGEGNFNKILKSYLESENSQGPPYTTSLDLIEHIKSETPSNIHFIIYDLFESADEEKFSEHYNKLTNKTD